MPTQLDIRAVAMYGKDIAPDIWQLHLGKQRGSAGPEFSYSGRRRQALRPTKGQEPAGFSFSRRDASHRDRLPSMFKFELTEESVMGIIAWIVLGLVAGLLANLLVPGRRTQGLIVTCLIGVAGALGGGWAATEIFHVHTLHGFFNLSTWITAVVGAAILLLIFHLFSASRSSGGRRTSRRRTSRRRTSWANR
jgi:uncharacterized membrane protein YeaQ/YmgE (transglycosylase-associated protein family)